MSEPESTPQVPAVGEIPFAPTGDDNELVFKAPWEAKSFALVVQLHQQGHFSWSEWAETLGAEIRAAGATDDGSTYYHLWLSAAEKLLREKSLCRAAELSERKSALEAAQGGPAPA
ncbi:MAG: nitrile hydratase accessory protein [Gammaproteobacteria bacterium]